MGFKAVEDSERWPDDGESSWRGPSCFGNAVRGVRGVSEVRADSWGAGERNIRPEPRSAGAHLKGQRRRAPKSKRSLQMGVPIPGADRQRKRGNTDPSTHRAARDFPILEGRSWIRQWLRLSP